MSAHALLAAGRRLVADLDGLTFATPVDTGYQPMDYAWPMHEAYARRYLDGPRRVLFLGMNPGPFGMVQTGIPFGEIAAVRDFLHLAAPIARPDREHPKRPVQGLACTRSEVSGRRLWGLFAERFADADAFFADHAVLNYCPLAFLDAGGANLTPDKLPKSERAALDAACLRHLAAAIAALRCEVLVGVGGFARDRLMQVAGNRPVQVIPHPSPANPAANRGWSAAATTALVDAGVWARG